MNNIEDKLEYQRSELIAKLHVRWLFDVTKTLGGAHSIILGEHYIDSQTALYVLILQHLCNTFIPKFYFYNPWIHENFPNLPILLRNNNNNNAFEFLPWKLCIIMHATS